MNCKKHWGVVAALIALTGCSDDDGGSGTIGGPGFGGWTPNSYLPSSSFKNQCADPRTGTDSSGQPFPDRQGTVQDENNWLRSWTNELYLWYDEVNDHNPASFSNPLNYFSLMRTFETSPSGAPKDQFHFTAQTAAWQAFSQSGTVLSYGATFLEVSGTPPREVVVLLVEPNSSAAAAGLQRGDRVVTVDNFDLINSGNTNALNAGLYPDTLNETHTLGIRNASGTRTVSLTAQAVPIAPVHTVSVVPTEAGSVGYILFNEHIATAEDALITAVEALDDANVQDLVLDLRYNSGGYLEIASQLAYMIAGSTSTAGRDFERMVWNDKHTATNPVTGQPLTPLPFVTETVGLSRPEGAPLPTLDLPRVFVLTSDETCSASESIMNGLRGVDIEVIQIGTTTCGKPYGFYDFDNCGTTYFSVQFQGVNAKGFGEYTDGFAPADTPADDAGVRIAGCTATDDYDHQLGDPAERMLSVALAYRALEACPSASVGQSKMSQGPRSLGAIVRPPYREIRRMRTEPVGR